MDKILLGTFTCECRWIQHNNKKHPTYGLWIGNIEIANYHPNYDANNNIVSYTLYRNPIMRVVGGDFDVLELKTEEECKIISYQDAQFFFNKITGNNK